MRVLLSSLLLGLLAVMPAAAAIDYSIAGISRQVEARANIIGGPTGDSEADDTTALGAWSASVDAFFPTINVGYGAAEASQVSNVGSLGASMTGSLSAEATDSHFSGANGRLIISSFILDADTPYISVLQTNGNVEVDEFRFEHISGSPTYAANSNGMLPAGTYLLQVDFQVFQIGIGNQAGDYFYDLRLVPEPSSFLLLACGLFLPAGLKRRR
jgi:hypothetical protein